MSSGIKRAAKRDGEVEGGLAYTLTKPVALEVLGQELAEHFEEGEPGLVTEGMPDRASASNPVTLWVVSPEIDSKTLSSVVAKHEVPKPEVDPLTALREKARRGEDFTDEEAQQEYLRAVLLLL